MVGSKKKVLISGAGVAGMMCAVLLDNEKYDIEMVERADSFRNIGFSIVLWKTGFRLLAGLLAANNVSIEEGKDYFKTDAFIAFGGGLLHQLVRVHSAGFAWTFERARLMEALEKALVKQIPPNQISFSRWIRKLEQREGGTGTRVVFDNGDEKKYDIVIIAEGINSNTRSLMTVAERILPVPYILRYAWFSTPTNLGTSAAAFLTKNHLGIIHPPMHHNLLGFYFKKGTSEAERATFQERVLAVIKQSDGTKARIDLDTRGEFELQEIHVDPYFSRGVVLVGDAAHGRPPTLGFGTSLAIEDAAFLCARLNALEDVSAASLEEVFRSYSDVRARRVEEVYRFQNFVHYLGTSWYYGIMLLPKPLKAVLGKWIERRLQKLASFELA